MPNFITVDSILHTYHALFDKSLRTVETAHLVGACTSLTQFCAGKSVKDLQDAPQGAVREAAAKNLAFFLVARAFLTGQAPSIGADVPGKQDIIALANGEIEKAKAHAGRSQSALMGSTLHYDQFVPADTTPAATRLQAVLHGHDVVRKHRPPWTPTRTDPSRAPPCLQALLITRMLAATTARAMSGRI